MKEYKVMAVDFDGTLCENKYPFIGNPQYDVIEEVINFKNEGNKIILWTCREGEILSEALSWCKERGLEFDAVNDSLQEWKDEFGDNPRKVGADIYLDDKAMSPQAFTVASWMTRKLQTY